jgi:thioredoxin reductase (NADPH)
METYDLIIVGAGPAGLNAAIYAGRYKMKTLVLGEIPGGLASEAVKICNLIGYKQITGMELAQRMEEQVRNLGVEIRYEKVTAISKKELFEVQANTSLYSARKIILAMGSEKRKLNLKKIDEFLGKGISYCATCDAAFYQGKVVGVVGGGDAALTSALLLAEHAEKVYIIYRREKFFRVEPSWAEAVDKNEKIEKIFQANVIELVGEKKLEGVKLDNGQELRLDGLFIEIGGTPNTKLAQQLKVELEEGHIKVDKERKTNVPGVFAAGDITNGPLKQIITAAADGAIAATSAHNELKKSK